MTRVQDKEVSAKEELAQFHNLVIKKFRRRQVYARFQDRALAEMRSLSSKNQVVKYRCFHQICMG